MLKTRNYNLTNPDDIAINRMGRVSPNQLEAYDSMLKRHSTITAALFFATIAVLILVIFSVSIVLTPPLDIWVGIGLLLRIVIIMGVVGATLYLIVSMIGPRRIEGKMLEGNVELLSGEVIWKGRKYAARTDNRNLKPVFGGQISLPPGRYRFYVLSETNFFLSTESQEMKVTINSPLVTDQFASNNHDLLSVLASVHHFDIASLEYNRAGKLSPLQSARLSLKFGMYMLSVIFLAGIAVWLYQYLVQQESPISFDILIFFAGLGLWLFSHQVSRLLDLRKGGVKFVGGTVEKQSSVEMILRWWWKTKYFYKKENLKWKGSVKFVDGTVEKQSSVEVILKWWWKTNYFYTIENLKWKVSKRAYNALVEGIQYRVYYTAHRETFVAIEPLIK